ncbi:MAG: hypothetical protein ABIH42_06660 [Planctomycetota bacterium]
MNKFRSCFEYILLRTASTAIEIMPLRVAYSFGRAIGKVLYLVDSRHKRVGMRNLKDVFGDKLTKTQRIQILKQLYTHLGSVMIELIIVPKLVKRGEWRKIVSIDNLQEMRETLQKKNPIILVTAHIGNWEIGSTVMKLLGCPIHPVARTMDNPLIDKYLTRLRKDGGGTIIKKHGSMRQTLKVLKNGGRIAVVADQNAPVDNVFVDFFGRKASVARGIAALALKTNALIIPGYSRRDPVSGKHQVILEKPIGIPSKGTTQDKIIKITEAFTKRIESWILDNPDQWLWVHKRWKTRPPEELKSE